jgi:hypothetical protein
VHLVVSADQSLVGRAGRADDGRQRRPKREGLRLVRADDYVEVVGFGGLTGGEVAQARPGLNLK